MLLLTLILLPLVLSVQGTPLHDFNSSNFQSSWSKSLKTTPTITILQGTSLHGFNSSNFESSSPKPLETTSPKTILKGTLLHDLNSSNFQSTSHKSPETTPPKTILPGPAEENLYGHQKYGHLDLVWDCVIAVIVLFNVVLLIVVTRRLCKEHDKNTTGFTQFHNV